MKTQSLSTSPQPRWRLAHRQVNQTPEPEIAQPKAADQALQTSEQFLRSLIESLPQNIIRKDLAGRVTFANGVACRTLGKSMDQLIGKTDDDLFPPELAAKYRSDDAQVIASGKTFETVEEHQKPAGGKIFVQVIKTRLCDAENRPVGVQILFWDVTEGEKAKREVAYERSLLQALLENCPDCIYFKDAQSRFIRCSRSMLNLFHVESNDQVLGKTDFDFFAQEHARQAFEDEQRIIRTGNPVINLLEKETWPDGHETWASTSKMLLRDAEGGIIGTFGISRDVTAHKRSEAALEALHKELLTTSRQAGMAEVATGVLHNVGNVLNSVSVSATLVSDRLKQSKVANLCRATTMLREQNGRLVDFLTTDPKGKLLPDYLATLGDQLAGEQTGLIAEMTSVGQHIEHIKEIVAMQQTYAKVSGAYENLPAPGLVEDALRMNSAAFERHRIQVVREFDEKTPQVCVDRHKVLQILINLLRNAKYAMDAQNTSDKRLVIQVGQTPAGRVKVTVSDNGIGIAPDSLIRIFNHGFTTKKDGHGFGLHSGANAAKEMGGCLTAHSDGPGQGATFTLELPAARSPRRAEITVKQETS
ncbi:MAG: PAS domain-containing protein [Verrucomicrobia bacterium]|jgi:PAS domain S-box-containing protein|nr:PAS domain-containing protein [Verrucomicrobiota bacterium]